MNAGINPLSAILRVKNGVLLKSQACIDIISRIVKEGWTVAKERKIKLLFDNPLERTLAVAKMTSENISSMLVDVLRGSKTEIDSINGAIVREGDKMGLSVANNRAIVNLLSIIESQKLASGELPSDVADLNPFIEAKGQVKGSTV